MVPTSDAKTKLLSVLQAKSVFYGDFVLSSGARSKYYIDCRLTTLDPEGAWLVGQVMHSLIQDEARRRGVKIDAVGGLTMGADPISLAVGMHSFSANDEPVLRPFVVRKTAKSHGQAKLIEGNFKSGDLVVVVEDTITTGDSTITAINAVLQAGGKIAFAVVLVDRQEGGCQKIEAMGYHVVTAFQRDELIRPDALPRQSTDCVPV